MSFFSIHHKSKIAGSRARTGTIQTAHGQIQTPAFVNVGTKGTVKALTPSQAKEIGTQVSFVNTYHLVVHPGSEIIKAHSSIHNFAKMDWSIFSDSGGFQVFSLANRARRSKLRDGEEAILAKLTDDYVVFRSLYDGSTIEFSPEFSIQSQINIGADLIVAFDECTYYPASHEYASQALHRTNSWLGRSCQYLKAHARIDYPQYLYGVIQGGTFEDLRVESARFISNQDVAGVAIGGVSVGESKAELRDQVRWISPYLPDDKPVHLLGVGQLDDIIDLVRYGIDTFDCVEPTRLARIGVLLDIANIDEDIAKWSIRRFDITESIYKTDSRLILSYSQYVSQFSYSYLHHLFKQKELLGYTLATMHNLALMEKLMSRIREQIETGQV